MPLLVPVSRWLQNRTSLAGSPSLAMDSDESLVLIPPRFEEAMETLVPDKAPEGHIGFFTSGSTGTPKVHFLARTSLRKNAVLSALAFDLKPTDRVLILASPWHIAGFTWFLAAEAAGAIVKLAIPHINDVPRFYEVLSAFRPTVLFAVPSVLHALLQQKIPFVHHIAIGGGPLPAEDYERLRTVCDLFTQAYGQTEAGGLISLATRDAQHLDNSFFRCVGFPPSEIVVSCEGTPDNPQSVWVQTPCGIKTSFYDTRDIGWMDASGALYVIGRKESGGNCNALTGVSMVLHK
jgi:acyl-coenzyme A synthetase/AMP-(fatty) acid ligase